MIVRLALKGTGTPSDGFTVPLPQYRMIAVDYINLQAVCEVPDADVPPELQRLPTVQLPNGAIPPAVTNAPPQAIAAWVAHLDSRYTEHAGQYRPTIA